MRAEPRVHRARGVTLTERVVLAPIVGILPAVALPCVLGLGADGRQARTEAVHGAVRAAARITCANALLSGGLGATALVKIEGRTVGTVFGYPAAGVGGIVRAAGLDPADASLIVEPGTPAAGTIGIAVAGARGLCDPEHAAAASPASTPRIVPSAPAGQRREGLSMAEPFIGAPEVTALRPGPARPAAHRARSAS